LIEYAQYLLQKGELRKKYLEFRKKKKKEAEYDY